MTNLPIPAGWVLVPREPTEAMLEAYDATCIHPNEEARKEHLDALREAWSAMLAAAPSTPDTRSADVPVGDRSPAQFFFEVGFGACWAEAYIRSGEKQPFELTDAVVDRAWQIAGEAHEDPAEFDAYLAAANASQRPQTADTDAMREALAECVAFIEMLKNDGVEQLGAGVHTGLRKGTEADDAMDLWRSIAASKSTAWPEAVAFALDPFFTMWGGDDALRNGKKALAALSPTHTVSDMGVDALGLQPDGSDTHVRLALVETGLCATTGEADRLIRGGGAYINGERVMSPLLVVRPGDVLAAGKKHTATFRSLLNKGNDDGK